MERLRVEALAEVVEVPVRPPALRIVRDHEPHLELTGYRFQTDGGLVDGARGEIVGAKRDPLVEERRDVLLSHGIHRDQRQLQSARGRIRHRRQVGVEAFHVARKVVQVPLDLQERHERQPHAGRFYLVRRGPRCLAPGALSMRRAGRLRPRTGVTKPVQASY